MKGKRDMFDYLLTKEQLQIRDEARDSSMGTREMILDMDTDKSNFAGIPEEAANRNLMLPLPREWGGPAAWTGSLPVLSWRK